MLYIDHYQVAYRRGASLALIRIIENEEDLRKSIKIIQTAFQTVADHFNLTPENCPLHPAFITYERLAANWHTSTTFYGQFIDDEQVGFIGIEKNKENRFYIVRLAVLPEYRHLGLGRELVSFACSRIFESGGTAVSIEIIDDNSRLKRWYEQLGFVVTGIEKLDSFPLTLCYMTKPLDRE